MTASSDIIHLDCAPPQALTTNRLPFIELAKKMGAPNGRELKEVKAFVGTVAEESAQLAETLGVPLRIACLTIECGKKKFDLDEDTAADIKDALEQASTKFDIFAMLCALAWQMLAQRDRGMKAST